MGSLRLSTPCTFQGMNHDELDIRFMVKRRSHLTVCIKQPNISGLAGSLTDPNVFSKKLHQVTLCKCLGFQSTAFKSLIHAPKKLVLRKIDPRVKRLPRAVWEIRMLLLHFYCSAKCLAMPLKAICWIPLLGPSLLFTASWFNFNAPVHNPQQNVDIVSTLLQESFPK